VLDAALRRAIAPPLDRLGGRIAAAGVSANAVTLVGFAVGAAALPLLSFELYLPALAAILLNRLADGLDGAVARCCAASDLGGYLDIVCDFLIYASVPFGFALARPENAGAAAFLLFAFVGTGTTFLAFAAIAAKRRMVSDARGPKSLYYLGGLTEGTETIVLFVAICLFPDRFAVLAYAFGGLCWITTASRLLVAARRFRG